MTALTLNPTNLLYDGRYTRIYRHSAHEIVKVVRETQPDPRFLTQFANEYDMTHALQISGVRKALRYETVEHRPVLFMEYFDGDSLKTLISDSPTALAAFFPVAIELARILGDLHQQRIIHKDINSNNILINPHTRQVQVIDFGLSSRIDLKTHHLGQPEALAGTLPYISPEQTGRMNRALDYRTDLYSLGITLFELLTGRLPFESQDPLELVHCHIAQKPPRADELCAAVPPILAEIVHKLLAKNAEDRYQSAYGLMRDLQRCAESWGQTGQIVPFKPGADDFSGVFQIPEKLYGREAEAARLLTAFERASRDQLELLLIAGYSGVGKTSLVYETHKPITARRGYFIAGKYDQFQRNIPYSAFIHAFSELVEILLTESAAQLVAWKNKILNAVSVNAAVMIEVIPALELLLGTQPAAPVLGPAESQNRFNHVFQQFVQAVCRPEHPLVLFIDDLQWADSASLSLLKALAGDAANRHCLIIGAYRDNEVNAAHPLILTLTELQKDGAAMETITLDNLTDAHVQQLLDDTLHSPVAARDLALLTNLVYEKTLGNAFFVIQFLKSLYEDGLLSFEQTTRAWRWDIAQIRACNMTDNVVTLMAGKIGKLNAAARELLKWAACVGNAFDLDTLATIGGQNRPAVMRELWPAVAEGLIAPLDESYKSLLSHAPVAGGETINPHFKFLHDRVQQAAYSLIAENQKQELHLKIGRQLLAHTPESGADARLFDIVNHLNLGAALLTDPAECRQLAGLNYRSGRKARESAAFKPALDYLSQARELSPDDVWDNDYAFALELHSRLAEAYYLNGEFEPSEKIIRAMLTSARTLLERARIYDLFIVQKTVAGKPFEAIAALKSALHELGVDLPADDQLGEAMAAERQMAVQNLGGRSIPGLLDEPRMADPEKAMAVHLMTIAMPSAYITNPLQWCVIVLKATNLCLRYGNCEDIYEYSCYGIMSGAVYGEFQAGYDFTLLALRLAEKNKNDAEIAKAANIVANYGLPWVRPLREGEAISRYSIQAGLNSGELQHGSYAVQLIYNLFFQGKSLPALTEDLPPLHHFSRQTRNQLAIEMVISVEMIVRNLRGLTADPFNFDLETLSEADYIAQVLRHNSLIDLSVYQIMKAQVLYLYGSYTDALLNTDEGKKNAATGTHSVAELNFTQSLCLTALSRDADAEARQVYLERIAVNQQQMKTWAESCPANYRHKYLLVEAELAWLEDRRWAAIDLYEEAIREARQNEFVQNEAIACECFARFWRNYDKKDIADLFLNQAYYLYKFWGADRKTAQLESAFPQVLQARAELNRRDRTISAVSTSNSGSLLDLGTVIKAGQAISGEIILEKLLQRFMKIIVESAGAQRGLLILNDKDQLFIAGERDAVSNKTVVLQREPVEKSATLSPSIVYYTARTKKPVVLADAARSGMFVNDLYVLGRKARSILCAPILYHDKFMGLLYFENNLAAGAFTEDRIEVLNLLSAQIAISLENSQLHEHALENERLAKELAVARQIQISLLPRRIPQTSGLTVAARIETAREVGGDYYDVIESPDRRRVFFVIADVAGKGIPASLLVVELRTLLHSLIGQNLSARDIVIKANHHLCKDIAEMDTTRIITMLLCCWDVHDQTFSYIGAGHEPLLVYRAAAGRCETCFSHGMWLGIEPDIAEYVVEAMLDLAPGDLALLYTDGVTECHSPTQELFGLERMEAFLCQYGPVAPDALLSRLLETLNAFSQNMPQHDDITLMALRRTTVNC